MNILYYVDYQRDRDTCMKIICLEQSEEHEIILYIRSLLGGGGGGVESGPFRGSGSKYILKGINSQCTCTCTYIQSVIWK